jgi:D-alanine-D-alanine ligase
MQVMVLCGGQSPEHRISVQSARNIVNQLDSSRYDVSVVYITVSGEWWLLPDISVFGSNVAAGVDLAAAKRITPLMGESGGAWQLVSDTAKRITADCVLPILHGMNGEDGTVQGLLTLMGVPFVGADHVSAALGMNKWLTRQLLTQSGIVCVPALLLTNIDTAQSLATAYFAEHGELFVKPLMGGSSIGVSLVTAASQIEAALRQAFLYDTAVMIEPKVVGRELEVAVLGCRGAYRVSCPGEICCSSAFYDYEAKYLDSGLAYTIIPAALTAEQSQQIEDIGCRVAEAVNCEGLVRVDGFLNQAGNFIINEVNSMPGFTGISLYPQLWQHMGLSVSQLCDELIGFAVERQKKQQDCQRAVMTFGHTLKTGVAVT